MTSTPADRDLPARHAGTVRLASDLEVRRLGFGAMRLTGEGIWGPPDDRGAALRVLRRVPELGIDFIDTADAYGPEVSEELIAEALHPYPAGLVIATKGGLVRPGPDEWKPNGRPRHLRQACEGSLRRLKVDRIDLYQLHRIDPEVALDDQLETLDRLREEGKIRYLGLSEVGVEEIERVRRHLDIVSVQNEYNLGERKWDEVVAYCERAGLAFIPWFPLGSGDVLEHEAVVRVADRHAAKPSQVALAWLLARSPATLVIPGTSSLAHLEENAAAAHLELDDDDRRRLDVVAGADADA